MITNAAIRAPSDTLGTSRKLCQSQNSAAVDIIRAVAHDGWHLVALVLITTTGPSTVGRAWPCPAQNLPRTR